MPMIIAALVLLTLLCLLNFALTIGILRRMRAQATGTDLPFELRPGASIGAFAVTTTTGEDLTAGTLSGTVAFLSADCDACHDQLPELLSYAANHAVTAVVAGDDPDTVAKLEPVARVVVADLDGGDVARAFRNTWTPALYVVADRVVTASAGRVAELPRTRALSER